MVLQKDSSIRLIDTLEEKQKILAALGVDILMIHPFSKEFSRLTPLEFSRDLLVNTFKISKVIIGYDHRFGRNREASIQDLHQFGSLYNFEVEEIPAQEVSSVNVSSTKIRTALTEGKIETVNNYLKRPYVLTGIVSKGEGLGRTIDFPTANITIQESYKLLPPNGVYRIQSNVDGELVYGMMNIGVRPTVEGTNKTIEVHFFNFNKDLYQKTLAVEIRGKLREEQKFDSLESLKKQLQEDKTICMELFDSEEPKQYP
jgi:riboflavin kinase/FMN adenylyltransferase